MVQAWSKLGLRRFPYRRAAKYIAAWPIVLIGCFIPIILILNFLHIAPGEGHQKTSAIFSGGLMPGLLLASVFVPVIEEILFRGMLYPSLANRYGMTAGLALSSLIFAVVHINPIQMLTAIILGPYLCWMYRRLGSIVPGMVLHALHNGALTYFVITTSR